MNYSKPYLDVSEQISLLQSRGLIITDYNKAAHYLSNIGYYRLSGYSYAFRKSTHNADGTVQVHDDFKDNIQFDDIIALYVFDKRLRLLLLDAIERIEVSLRVAVALEMGRHDALAHMNPHFHYDNFFKPYLRKNGETKSDFEEWKKKYNKSFKDSHEDFVQHFKEKYPQNDMPIWIATELWDFGMLSIYTGNLKDVYKIPIAAHYGIGRVNVLESWLRSINVVRNICAHHGRLWNRVMAIKPKYPANNDALLLHPLSQHGVSTNRIFATMCIIQYFMQHISPNSSWNKRVIKLIDDFPNSPYINLEMIGVKEGWKHWDLWQ
jgi:abortive infection bacteriophage resistance protein